MKIPENAWRVAMSLWLGVILMLAGAGRVAGAEEKTGDHGAAATSATGTVHSATTAGISGAEHAVDVEPSILAQIGYSYLTAYMFCLSICLGCLFMVFIHHLFDAGWSASIRRVVETIASLFWPWMLVLLIPILLLQNQIFPWLTADPATDHSLAVKRALFNRGTFNILIILLLLSWGWIAYRLRSWSIAQDKDGAAIWTRKARVQSAWGIFYYAISLTLGCIYLMKSLQYQFFSTMYGVYYFAGSVWLAFATVYGVVFLLSRPGQPLEKVVYRRQLHDLAILFFAFTVFYAYIHFSQYFLIWNAAIPEETFWYVDRERGSWKWVGFLILFGHFFVPFLMLLNQDVKWNWTIMSFTIIWAWLMHYADMTFNIMPIPHPHGLHLTIWDPLFWIGMAASLAYMFWQRYQTAAPYPLRDPRLKEAITHHAVPAPGQIATHH